jgi:hypothetical protein
MYAVKVYAASTTDLNGGVRLLLGGGPRARDAARRPPLALVPKAEPLSGRLLRDAYDRRLLHLGQLGLARHPRLGSDGRGRHGRKVVLELLKGGRVRVSDHFDCKMERK